MKKILLLLFLPLIFFSAKGQTNSFRGGTIIYTNLSGDLYQIRLYFVGDTAGILQNPPVIYFGDGDSIIPSLMNCPVFDNITNCVYNCVHTYPGPGSYMISAFLSPRISGINNITNSQNTIMNLSSLLIINPFFFPGNDSPIGSVQLYDQALVNSTYIFDTGTFDNDGDSLSYHLTPCNQQTSYPQATTSFTIDSITGDVTWNQPYLLGPHNFCILIKEWRNINSAWYNVGYSIREVEVEVVPFLSVPENNPSTTISLFPNPSNTEINFSVNGLTEKENSLIITDITGKQVQIIKDIKNGENKIPVSTLAPGLYFYNLNNSKGKFIVSQ